MSNVFEEALKLKEEQKKKEEQSKTSKPVFFDYEQVSLCGLTSKENTPFRIVGNPAELRKSEFDAKIILHSQIVKDDGTGYIKVNWPWVISDKTGKPAPDPKWILTKLFEKVTKTGNWVKFSESDIDGVNITVHDDGKIKNKKGHDSKFVPTYKNTKSFARIQSNIKDGDKYEKNFYPSTRAIVPVIGKSEEDYKWCVENKHCQVLTSKKTPYSFKNNEGEEITIYYTDEGIPKSLYDMFFEKVVKYRQTWDLDLLVYKSGQAQNAYDIKDALANPLPDGWADKLSTEALTEEEASWGRYDLDKLFPTKTSYQKLHKNLIGLFKQADVDTNSTFSEELERLVEIEKAEYEANKPEETKEATPKAEEKVAQENKVEEAIQETPRVARETTTDPVATNNSLEDQCKLFPYWDNLSDADREDILQNAVKVREQDMVFEFKNGINVIPCDNKECGIYLPGTVLSCPKCNSVFK